MDSSMTWTKIGIDGLPVLVSPFRTWNVEVLNMLSKLSHKYLVENRFYLPVSWNENSAFLREVYDLDKLSHQITFFFW